MGGYSLSNCIVFSSDRWVCIYPAYIDSNKTRVAGRRVPKSRAVERPTCAEICDVLTAANFKVGLEAKFYPRDNSKEDDVRGRVRVQLKNEDGTPVNPALPTRKSIYYCFSMHFITLSLLY